MPVSVDKGADGISDISEGYSGISRTWSWKHSVFYSLLFCGDNDHAVIYRGDPFIYIICFSETITILSGIGIVLVLSAVIILNSK